MGRTSHWDENGMKKGPWSPQEDQKLIDYIQKYGHRKWRTVPMNAELKRCGKSCRLRWINYLRPDIKRGGFSLEEEDTIIKLHSVLGNKWSAIATRLPGRTDNEIKNYWNSHVKKRLIRMGIDPVTHGPRLDLLQLYSFLNSPLSNSSHQLNIQSLFKTAEMNTNFPNLVNPLALSPCKNLQNFPQFLHDNQFSIQNQLQSNLLMQDDMGQFSSSLITNSSSKNSLPSLCQNNRDESTYMGPSLVSPPEIGQPLVEFASENKIFPSNNDKKAGFGSIMSTPSSTAYVNGSTEDEKYTYCSDMMFDIPSSLDFGEFM